jgi:hypothetical protein
MSYFLWVFITLLTLASICYLGWFGRSSPFATSDKKKKKTSTRTPTTSKEVFLQASKNHELAGCLTTGNNSLGADATIISSQVESSLAKNDVTIQDSFTGIMKQKGIPILINKEITVLQLQC